MPPQTRYAKSGDVHIAYQVVGDGPFDLVLVPGAFSHVEVWWEEPLAASFLQRLASFSRLILFDKRGTGLSDRVPDHALPTLEERMDDVRAVMDAVGSQRAALFGFSEVWQLVINTGTTIVTFLMVFLVQNSQNRDAAAIQAKLDEIIRAVESAREHFIGIEHLTDVEIEDIRAALEQESGDDPRPRASVERLLRRR